MKTLSFVVFSFYILVVISSCTSGSNKAAAEDQNKENLSSSENKNDAQLLVDLVAAQYDEIRFSKYAVTKSADKELKDIAQMMITDHTSFLNSLKSVAAKKNITIPAEDSTAANKKINSCANKNENDFDKGWTNDMISAHKDAIDKIQKGLDNTQTDSDIKETLNAALPTVRKHLDMLNQYNDKLKQVKS